MTFDTSTLPKTVAEAEVDWLRTIVCRQMLRIKELEKRLRHYEDFAQRVVDAGVGCGLDGFGESDYD